MKKDTLIKRLQQLYWDIPWIQKKCVSDYKYLRMILAKYDNEHNTNLSELFFSRFISWENADGHIRELLADRDSVKLKQYLLKANLKDDYFHLTPAGNLESITGKIIKGLILRLIVEELRDIPSVKGRIYTLEDPQNLDLFSDLKTQKFKSVKTAEMFLYSALDRFLAKAQWSGEAFTKDYPDVIVLNVISDNKPIIKLEYRVRK